MYIIKFRKEFLYLQFVIPGGEWINWDKDNLKGEERDSIGINYFRVFASVRVSK